MSTATLGVLLAVCLQLTLASDDVNPLQAVVQQLTQQLTSLQARMTQHDTKMAAMETLVQQQAETIRDLKAAVHSLTNQMASQTPFVAFDVHYSHDPYNGVANHDVMKFDVVAANVGNGYNPQNGMFQAPVSGTYMFYVKVTPNPKGHIYVYLVREGTNIDSANANDDTANETGDTVKIVQLSKGDRVWLVKNAGVSSVRGWAHTKLAGYLLRAD